MSPGNCTDYIMTWGGKGVTKRVQERDWAAHFWPILPEVGEHSYALLEETANGNSVHPSSPRELERDAVFVILPARGFQIQIRDGDLSLMPRGQIE